jgi:hypothetical protein
MASGGWTPARPAPPAYAEGERISARRADLARAWPSQAREDHHQHPNGSRCRSGLSVTRPFARGVVSPNQSAVLACENCE